MNTNKQQKQQIVDEITQKAEKAKGLVFTNYQGLTHKQLETFKKSLRSMEAEYVVTKNTLLTRALEGKINNTQKDAFREPTATLFIYNDIIEPLKHLMKTVKDLKLPAIKFGIMEGRALSESDITKFSTLPALPVLRAQFLGQLQSPIAGLHRALNWNLQRLVLTLNAVKEKKQ